MLRNKRFSLSFNALIYIGCLLLLPYLMIVFYSFPSGDDFTYAILGGKDFSWDTVLNERERWNGRYISNVFVIANPIRWGAFLLYQVIVGALIIVFGHALYTFYNYWIKHNKKSILLTIYSLLVVFSLLPSLSEGLYWYTSSVTYFLSAIVYLYWLTLFFNFLHYKNKFHFLYLVVLMIFFSGLNEMIVLCNLLFIGICIVLRKRDVWLWGIFVLQILIFIYVLSAEGNNVRAAYFEDKHNVLYTLEGTFLNTLRFIGRWLMSPPLWIGVIVLLRTSISFFKPVKLKNSYFLAGVFFLLSLVAIACAAPLWTTGMIGQYRTPNLALFLFIPILVILILSFKIKFPNIILPLKFIKNKLWIFIFIISLIFWGNARDVQIDLLSGDAAAFHFAQKNRLLKIQTCIEEKKEFCSIPYLDKKPKSIFVYDISDDSDLWFNKCYSKYYRSNVKIIPAD